jgi:ammonium transporter Rh
MTLLSNGLILTLEVLSIIFYGLFTTYGNEVDGITDNENNTISNYYPLYQDIHVMIFVGFGFLMTFMRSYNLSAVSYNFLLGAIAIQYSILINGFFHNLFHNEWDYIELDIQSLITGDFAAGAVLISFGAVLGKLSILQLIIMTLFELVFYSLNESLGVIVYQAVDMGGSMYVHSFGAYFGLAVSKQITNSIKKENGDFEANNFSDLAAMCGTLFLWIYWSSFNGALAVGNAQHRVVINTVLALTNSCISAFIMSKLLRPDGKFSMVDIQNATLAGGVAVGSSADLVIGPHIALLIGLIAGCISVIGYIYVQPWLLQHLKLHDTCGVHNLHGLPGIIGGLSGFISASLASNEAYGDNIGLIFPARLDGRDNYEQGLFQLAALFTTLFIAISGGTLTGFIIKRFKKIELEEYAADKETFDMDYHIN